MYKGALRHILHTKAVIRLLIFLLWASAVGYGTDTARISIKALQLPEGSKGCDVIVEIRDRNDRITGQGIVTFTKEDAGSQKTLTVGSGSALPRIDTLYASDIATGINDTFSLHAEASDQFDGRIEQYAWKLGEGDWIVTKSADTTLVAPSTAQKYPCILRVTDDGNNQVYDTVVIQVETRAPVAVAGNDTTVGVNDMVYLDGSGSSDETEITEFEWKCGSEQWHSVKGGDTVRVAPSTAQEWICVLRVRDNEANLSYDTIRVTVDAMGPVVRAGGDTAVGINDTLRLIGSRSIDEDSIVAYEWKVGTGPWQRDPDGDTTIVAPSQAQTLVCSLRVKDNERNVNYDVKNVTVETRPPKALALADSVAGFNESVVLSGSKSTDETKIVKYEWKCGDSQWTGVDNGDTSIMTPLKRTVFVCSLRVTDNEGNLGYDGASIAVKAFFSEQSSHTVDTSAASSIYLADIDGDEDMDIVAAQELEQKIVWYANDGNGLFDPRIVTESVDGAQAVYCVDIDKDGDMDVLSASKYDDKIAWHKNDGSGSFASHPVDTACDGASAVHAADIDGDGDVDIFGASTADSTLILYKNNGTQQFSSTVIKTGAISVKDLFSAELDGNGGLDILVAYEKGGRIDWLRNDGKGNFDAHTITEEIEEPWAVYATDIDGDGDIDPFSASNKDDKVIWYENKGKGRFTAQLISDEVNSARTVFATDMDFDSDIDVISASRHPGKVVWFEQTQEGVFVPHHFGTGASSVYGADIDGDGDIDIIAASAMYTGDGVVWYENGR